jgi:peroxidase
MSGNVIKKKSFSGDARADEAPNLGTNHLLFVRQHNKIAKRLQEINQNWSDETILFLMVGSISGLYLFGNLLPLNTLKPELLTKL